MNYVGTVGSFFQFFFNQDFGHRNELVLRSEGSGSAFNSFLIKILVIERREWIRVGQRRQHAFNSFLIKILVICWKTTSRKGSALRAFNSFLIKILVIQVALLYSACDVFVHPGFQFFFNQDFGHLKEMIERSLAFLRSDIFQFFFNQDFGHRVWERLCRYQRM